MFQRRKRESQVQQQEQQQQQQQDQNNEDVNHTVPAETQAVLEMMAAKSQARHPHSKDEDGIEVMGEEGEEADPEDDDDDDLFKFSPPVQTADVPGLLPPHALGGRSLTAGSRSASPPPPTTATRLRTGISTRDGNTLDQQARAAQWGGDGISEAQRIANEYQQQQLQYQQQQPPQAGKRRQPYQYPGSPIYTTSAAGGAGHAYRMNETSPTRENTPVIELADRLRQASTMTTSYPPEYGYHPDDMRSERSYSGEGINSLKKRSSSKVLPGGNGGRGAIDDWDGSMTPEVGYHANHGQGEHGMSEMGSRIHTAGESAAGGGFITTDNLVDGEEPDKHSFSAFELEDEEDSPYPEVRASVSNIDDPEMPCLTFRAWVIGLCLTAIGGGCNLFFSARYPAPIITPITVQVISYPIGKFLAYILPTKIYYPPRFAQKFLAFPSEFSLNPGPFNIKEHTVIVIMASISMSPSYALNFTMVLDRFYNIPKGIGFDFLTVFATNVIGFSFAGICRRYLVWPASLVWPQNLVTCTLFNTFHAEDDDGSDGSLTRYRFFTIVFGAAFCWYFLPGFLFVALSSFSFICWAAPTSRVTNQLFGVASGLGMSVFTFDWSQISYIGSPLIVPWWAEVNMFVGFVVLYWVLTPILYYKNIWNFAYMPISASGNFDRFGQYYNVSAVISPDTTIDEAGYQAYSPLFMSTTYATVYALSFTLSTAAIVHTLLHNGKEVFLRMKTSKKKEDEDVHAKLMRNYPEVPDWWYWLVFAVFTALAIVAIEVYKTDLPIWGLALALLVPAIYILPGGYIYALTAQLITINLVAEVIPGYVLDGKPVANMLFKTFSVQCLQSGLYFVQDLKLGHYMKIPPRVTFMVQLVATCVASASQVGVKKALEALVPDLCTPDQPSLLSCPTSAVVYEASIIWGVIGPKRFFGSDSLYQPLLYFLLLGALLPIPFFLATKKWPNSYIRYVNIPVLLNGASYIPPATGINYSSWFIVGFIFQYWMRRHRFRWWSKFCFITSAGLEAGTVLSAIFIFFALQLPRNGDLSPNWWGNEVFKRTADWLGIPYLDPPQEGFGPTTWE